MNKTNCWEIKKCGRELGGVNTKEFGVCPAAEAIPYHGINNGKNGGRICWEVAGTFCGGRIQGDFAQKQVSCMACEVFKKTKQEEGDAFVLMKSAHSCKAATR